MTNLEHRPPVTAKDTEEHAGHKGHNFMMIACCIPMLVIAVVLVATGIVSAGFLLYAVVCLGMMFMMMKMMDRGGMKM